ncbi:1-phosphofructokinase family hexose kinase [Microbacterium sp.]|uniref:1-phosphofructokinase family hexose kinase n=1 Tax=Microbacterium sp. TaxID=51671 RepID=UPI0028112756|nr:1-phosphofructokinase family hexose kinase [Microbacterium sp.]
MIVTVTPNPALDLTWQVAALAIGQTHRADAGAVRAGGKGLNVARVAHAEGADVLAITTVGGNTGEEFAAELRASGAPHVLVPVQAPTRRSAALVDLHLGDTTIVNERGLNPTDEEWASLHRAVDGALPTASVLVISGSLPPGAPEAELAALIEGGRRARVPVIVDTSGPAMLQAADAGATVLKPNAVELAEATGRTDPADGARELIDRGAELVLVSLGADGMLAVTASGLHRARLPEPLIGNPTGAGDAAVAACAVLLAAGVREPAEILRRATAWSAAAVLMPLAGEIDAGWAELEQRVEISVLPGRREEEQA